jgi:MFS family permease
VNRYIVYILIHLVTLLTSMSVSAVSVAFPEITSTFNASLVLAGWVISIYQLVAVCMGVLTGKLCEIYGRKYVFMACTFLFILGSLLCSLAPNIQLLIFFRLIQSFGGGAILPAIVGIVVQLFPRSRQRAISWGMSFFVVGGIIGPSVGAWLLTSLGWRSIFWFIVPIGLLCWIPIFFLL